VIAAGEDFDPAGEQFLGDARRDAEAGGGIFAVGDAEINFALGKDVREPVVNDLAAGRADDVADKQDFQIWNFRAAMVSAPSGRMA
jgi:hypothetical protein